MVRKPEFFYKSIEISIFADNLVFYRTYTGKKCEYYGVMLLVKTEYVPYNPLRLVGNSHELFKANGFFIITENW